MSEETVIVSGFARCGSTMLMRMLHAGGLPVVADSTASFEADEFRIPAADMDWARFAGKAIKVLDPHRWNFAADQKLRFLFLSRDCKEQGKSHAKLLRACGVSVSGAERRGVVASLRRDYGQVSSYLAPHPVLHLSFEQILANPHRQADKICRFLDGKVNAAAMAAVVVKRRPACLPDMAFELSLIAQAGGAA